jgi:hypothetical protein
VALNGSGEGCGRYWGSAESVADHHTS